MSVLLRNYISNNVILGCKVKVIVKCKNKIIPYQLRNLPVSYSEMLGKCLREIRKVIVYMSSHIDMPLN